MTEFKLQFLECKRCGHNWVPRVNPVQCPRCHSYHWFEDKSMDKRLHKNGANGRLK